MPCDEAGTGVVRSAADLLSLDDLTKEPRIVTFLEGPSVLVFGGSLSGGGSLLPTEGNLGLVISQGDPSSSGVDFLTPFVIASRLASLRSLSLSSRVDFKDVISFS